jgi:hypothetical protein
LVGVGLVVVHFLLEVLGVNRGPPSLGVTSCRLFKNLSN